MGANLQSGCSVNFADSARESGPPSRGGTVSLRALPRSSLSSSILRGESVSLFGRCPRRHSDDFVDGCSSCFCLGV